MKIRSSIATNLSHGQMAFHCMLLSRMTLTRLYPKNKLLSDFILLRDFITDIKHIKNGIFRESILHYYDYFIK